jgi:hypothetical protein
VWTLSGGEMKSRKKDINKTQHNTKYTHTHTSLCQELAQVPLMSKFSNLLEARCLIDSIQWASSSPRPAKAGRQAGSMCYIQDPIPKVPFRCYV